MTDAGKTSAEWERNRSHVHNLDFSGLDLYASGSSETIVRWMS